MDTVEIQTDLGPGFLKAMGNRQGEHALACELIGSSLAEWIGLPTLDFTLFQVDADQVLWLDADEQVPISPRRRAKPGPAFLSRGIHAATWDSLPASESSRQRQKASGRKPAAERLAAERLEVPRGIEPR
jgi:hypothetical protein